MSIEAQNWAWGQKNLTPSQKLVLIAIADYANEDHACFPRQRSLAEKTGIARETCLRALTSLEDRGLITSKVQTRADGSNTSKFYRLNVDGQSRVGDIPAGGGDNGTGGCDERSQHKQEPPSEPSLEPPSFSEAVTESHKAEAPDAPPRPPSDAELRSLLDAYNAGMGYAEGTGPKYGFRQVQHLEALSRIARGPDEVEKVAAAYREEVDSWSVGKPSLKSFAEKYEDLRAEALNPRQKPIRGSGSTNGEWDGPTYAGRPHVYNAPRACPTHPGIVLDYNGVCLRCKREREAA